MANLPKRPCSYPGGCASLVDPGTPDGRCPAHPRKLQTEREQRGKTTAERGYGAQHKRLRVQCFIRDGWKCVDCGWVPELVATFAEARLGLPPSDRVLEELRQAYARNERHLHADHDIPVELRPDLALSLANYRTRCNVCHSVKTASEDGGFGNG